MKTETPSTKLIIRVHGLTGDPQGFVDQIAVIDGVRSAAVSATEVQVIIDRSENPSGFVLPAGLVEAIRAVGATAALD